MEQMNIGESRINIKFAKIIIGFLWVTYLIYLILPWELDKTDVIESYTIIFLTLVSIAFYHGCKTVPIYRDDITQFDQRLYISNRLITISLIYCILITSLYIKDMLIQGMGSFSLSLGDNYLAYQESEAKYNSFAGQLYVLFSPFRYFFIGYCIVDYKLMSKRNKVLYYIFLIITFIHSLIQGKNVGLGYLVTIVGVTYLIVCLKNNNFKNFKKCLVIGLLVFCCYFILATTMRTEAYGGLLGDKITDNNNIIVRIFGLRWGSGILQLLNYFSHGYKGLNYCLQLPFQWTYGYGGAMGIDSYVVQYLGVDSQIMNTYPGRMETTYGYSGLQSWPTAFPWWASDITFVGVVILMYFIGRFSCILIKESLIFSNKYSTVFLSFFSILLVCIPLNNQLLQTRPNFISSVIFFFLWFVFFRNKQINVLNK